MVPLPETDIEEDHGDAGLTISNNGQEYPLQIVLNVQETEVCGDPWCPCQLPPILRHEEGPRQGKAMEHQWIDVILVKQVFLGNMAGRYKQRLNVISRR